jgi:hypothetical protein
MIQLNILVFGALLGAIALLFALAWSRLPSDGRQPVAVYVIGYGFTYCIGGVWIGLTDGDALAAYFHDRLYIPNVGMLGVEYWVILLAPLLIPICVAAALMRRRPANGPTVPSQAPARSHFIAIFAAICAFAVYRVFHGGYGAIEALLSLSSLHGDTATIIERRLELFTIGTTAAFGIIYSTLPTLCHVAIFRAKEAGGSWRVVAVTAILITLGLSLATFQMAPAVVFIVAVTISAANVRFVRMTSAKAVMYGLIFLVLLQGMNGWKFEDWTFLENLRHITLRMPAAYPYYLECFPHAVHFLGADWLGALSGTGADPGGPFVVSRYMYPDGLTGGAMAAPAHVQAYAEGGSINAIATVAVIGLVITGVAILNRRSREGAIAHAAYIQGLVTLYYLTQTSLRGVLWHSYGFFWSLVALALLQAASFRPAGSLAVAARADAVSRVALRKCGLATN